MTGEDAAQATYDEALDEYLPAAIRSILVEQRDKLNTSFEMVKKLREAAKDL